MWKRFVNSYFSPPDPTPFYSPAQIRVFSVLLIYSTGLKSPKELCGLNSL